MPIARPPRSPRFSGTDAAGGSIRRAFRILGASPCRSSPSFLTISDRRRRSSAHDRGASPAATSSILNRSPHATSGRHRSWSTTTIITIIATIAPVIARPFPASIAALMYAPIPGRRKSCSPRRNASVIVRKNHPPAMLIIPFQTRPTVDAGSSTTRKRRQGLNA